MKQRRALAGVWAVLAWSFASAAAEPPSGKEIIEAADRARNPQQSFRATVSIVEYSDGRAREQIVLTNHVKMDAATGQFRNLARYVRPPRDSGKLVLLNGGNMWFYDPSSKASIRISPQQRLTGQASNGDVLTVNLARDFEATRVGDETIQDADHVERSVWHLELVRATPEAMYARLECWIDRVSFRTVKAKFYSDSGRLVKIAYFRKFEQSLGGVRPTETIIIDALNSKSVTKVTYADVRSVEIPDAWFQRDYMARFNEE